LLRWRAEFLKLPIALLTTPLAAQELRSYIQKTEAVYAALRKIATDLVANTMPDGAHKDTQSRARTIVTNGPMTCAYYVGAERGLAQLMAYLAETKDEEADTHWRITLTQAVQSARQALDQSLGKTPYVLRAQARADAEFGRLLASLRPLQTTPSLTATLEETL
jgi:hypothetical protein